MSKRDYYQVLGIDKKASEADIKKAYKKLVIKWHPDKNPNNKEEASEKFRQISEAYQNLSDPEKRKIYDTYGFQGPKSQGFHHFNFQDADSLFSKFFNNHQFDDDPFFSSFFGKRNGQKGGRGGLGGFGGFGGFGGSLFDNDDFFSNMGGMGGMGGQGGFTSFSSSSTNMGGRMPGMSKSVSTTTKNGKTVITKKTTITNEDGTKDISEQIIENGKKLEKKYSIQPGESEATVKARIKY